MEELNWQQKLRILQYIGIVDLHMSAPGDWTAQPRKFRVRTGPADRGFRPIGKGRDPGEAVNDLWHICVDELGDKYLYYETGYLKLYVRYEGAWNRYL